jgi:uncharacterized OsmC-like protein
MTGTLGGALSARDIPAVPSKVYTDVEMEVERLEPKVIVISKVRLNYHLTVPKGKRAEAERAVSVHAQGCPVYRSLQRGIAVEWAAEIVEEE